MATFDKFRSVYTHDELMERLRGIKHVALDMDGTIYMGMSLFPYTKPFLEGLKELGIGYSFLTNNPSKSIADYLHKLETLGIHATREEMYTTALATIDYIKQHYPAAKRLFLLGTPSMISEFEAAGFESAADSADDVPDQIAMVGDRIYTDVAMAHNAKAMGVLVLSGETTLDVADKADPQPHITADSIEVLGRLIREAHGK